MAIAIYLSEAIRVYLMPVMGAAATDNFRAIHDVTLQRLDVFHPNNGRPVFYDAEPFAATVDRWNNVPVIYAVIDPGESAEHPRFEDVNSGTLPGKFRVVGRVSGAHLADTGEAALKGSIQISDPEIEEKARSGRLSISTGLSSPEVPDPRLPGATRIAGPVTPNHVLIFDRGTCQNCYPNDHGAMFHNLEQEPEMDDESKGLLKTIADALTRRDPPAVQHVNLEEYETLKKNLESAQAQIAELSNLQAEVATLRAEKESAIKDAKWAAMKVNLPAGWLGEKEPETRNEFEADPGAFALKLVEFKNAQPRDQTAEGNTSAASPDCGCSEEQRFKNMAAEVAKSTGILFV